jgi:hypothetical protein
LVVGGGRLAGSARGVGAPGSARQSAYSEEADVARQRAVARVRQARAREAEERRSVQVEKEAAVAARFSERDARIAAFLARHKAEGGGGGGAAAEAGRQEANSRSSRSSSSSCNNTSHASHNASLGRIADPQAGVGGAWGSASSAGAWRLESSWSQGEDVEDGGEEEEKAQANLSLGSLLPSDVNK